MRTFVSLEVHFKVFHYSVLSVGYGFSLL